MVSRETGENMALKKMDEKAILKAAAEEFAEKGFSGARVDEIAKKAGINKAMLYYRVGDKEELYRRVVMDGQRRFMAAILDALGSSADAEESIRSILEGVASTAAENRLLPSIILREIAGNGRTLPEEGLDGIVKFMETIRSVTTMGVEDGCFRNIDPIALQFTVLGAVFTLSLTEEMRKTINPDNPGPVSPKQISEALLDIISRGILAKGDLL